MPGISQVILTHKEIGALLEAAPTGARVREDIWRNLEPKLTAALGPIACPVPTAREEKHDPAVLSSVPTEVHGAHRV